MEEIVTLSLSADDYDPLKSWQLAAWCEAKGADEWTISAMTVDGPNEAAWLEGFDEVTKPFRPLTAERPGFTELWRLNSASFAILQELLPDGLFTYHVGEDGWLEDPVFYRRGEFMLEIVSHEQEGFVRVTKAEQRLLEAEGFVFRPRGLYVGY